MSAPLVAKVERIGNGPDVLVSWTGGNPPYQLQASVEPGNPDEPWTLAGNPTLKQEQVITGMASYEVPEYPAAPDGSHTVRNDKCFFRVQSDLTMPAPAVTRANNVNTVSWVPPEE